MLPNVQFRPCLFLDGLRFLVVRHQSRGEEERLLTQLHEHTRFADLGLNYHPRDFELILTIVAPDAEGLRLIAPCSWLIPRTGEVALDFLVNDEYDAKVLQRFFDRHHVQGWHNTETFHHETTTYTGPPHRPGRIFSAYSDHPSKVDAESSCCHVEARYQGIAALRRIGIHAASDWLSFDQLAFWKKIFASTRSI